MTARALRLEDWGVKHSNLKTGVRNERAAHQPAAPTYARRHERAALHGGYATRGSERAAAAVANKVSIASGREIAVRIGVDLAATREGFIDAGRHRLVVGLYQRAAG